MAKVSLPSQIGAVEAITTGKFPLVASSQSARDLMMQHLTAAAQTLHWIQAHEAEIRDFVTNKNRGK